MENEQKKPVYLANAIQNWAAAVWEFKSKH